MNLKIKCKILINHYFNYYFNYRLQIKKFSTTPVSCMQRAQTQKYYSIIWLKNSLFIVQSKFNIASQIKIK